jgi:hypothetical protein
MKTPPALAAKVIQAHGLNTLAAYDVAERLRLFYIEAAPDELEGHLSDLVNTLEGTFLVKAWKRGPNPKGGRRKEAEATYSWHIQGRTRGQVEDQPVQGMAPQVPQAFLDELATLRAEKAMREKMEAMEADQEDGDEEEDGQDTMGQLVNLLTGLLMPKAPADAVAGAERGHPSALQGQRMEQIMAAIKNLHAQDPQTFAQYEAALLQSYGKAS